MLGQSFAASGIECVGSLTEASTAGTLPLVKSGGVSPSTQELSGGTGQNSCPAGEFQVALDKQLSSLRDVLGKHHESEITKLRNENSKLRAALARLDSNHTISHSDVEDALVDTNKPQEESGEEAGRNTSTQKSAKRVIRAGSSIEIHDVFDGDHSHRRVAVFTTSKKHKLTDEFVLKDATCVQNLVWHPFTAKRIFYDLMSMSIVTYDVITLPMEAAEILSATAWYRGIGVFVTVFWTIDMLLSFFQGFTRKGLVELRLKETALAYLRSWFLFDFALLLIDYLTLFMESVSAAFGLARGAKTLRIGRALRLLRLSRMMRLPGKLKLSRPLEMVFGSEIAESMERVSAWIAGLMLVNHLIACIWVLLGRNTSPGWVEFAMRAYKLKANKEASSWYLYATGLHWSLTQFTPASMEVVPVNVYERIFTICTMFSALVLFSSFVSSITNEVASMRLKKRVQITNNNNLIRFLRENYVPLDLGARIQEVAATQQANQKRIKRIHESDVDLLKGLPVSLLQELHVEVYLPTLALNPFLDRLSGLGFQAVTSFCHAAMRQQSMMAGQDLFSRGQDGTHMIFVMAGEAKYIHGIHTALEVRTTSGTATIGEEQYLCEQVLFLKWKHQGLLTAFMPCELATLEGAAFHKTVHSFPEILESCKRTAHAYADKLMVSTEELTDLPLDTEAMDAILDGAGVIVGTGTSRNLETSRSNVGLRL